MRRLGGVGCYEAWIRKQFGKPDHWSPSQRKCRGARLRWINSLIAEFQSKGD
jgi:hypothetical protein